MVDPRIRPSFLEFEVDPRDQRIAGFDQREQSSKVAELPQYPILNRKISALITMHYVPMTTKAVS